METAETIEDRRRRIDDFKIALNIADASAIAVDVYAISGDWQSVGLENAVSTFKNAIHRIGSIGSPIVRLAVIIGPSILVDSEPVSLHALPVDLRAATEPRQIRITQIPNVAMTHGNQLFN